MSDVVLDAYAWSGLEYLETISGPGAIAEMVGDFTKDAPDRLTRMQAALAVGDGQALSRLAHDLKSSSATLGVLQLSALAARIELTARDSPERDLASILGEVAALLPGVLIALEERARHYPA